MLPFANPALAYAGFLTVAISVRDSGQAVFPAQLNDAHAALTWLRENPLGLPLDRDHIGVWGQSAGGHLAAMAALTLAGDASARNAVQAVVTISAPSELRQPGGAMQIDRPSPVTSLVGGEVSTQLERLREASPVAHVTADAPPFLIIHGTHDETVPFEQAERLHRALHAVRADTRLLPVVGGHHNLRSNPEAPYDGLVWRNVASEAARFFQRHLT